MERRKFVIGLGSLAAGGAAATGTGAFSTVNANRDLTVDVEGDDDAFLRLSVPSELENSEYASYNENDQLVINFDENANVTGTGVNTDAFSRFDEVFRVTNQGSQAVDLFIGDNSLSGDKNERVRFYVQSGSTRYTIENGNNEHSDSNPTAPSDDDSSTSGKEPLPLGSGGALDVGIEIDMDGIDSPAQEWLDGEEITIMATTP